MDLYRYVTSIRDMGRADYSYFDQHPELRQHVFELDFKVDTLRTCISKSSTDGVDNSLGDLDLEGFALSFTLAKYNMTVDINLRYFFLLERRMRI
jgi:hypothetical protein